MQFIRTIAAAAIVAIAGSGGAWAKTLASTDGPAEQPPASFKGTQYVDSNGCIFVRAGYNGTVSWVPRVTRDKKVICGYQPTFAQAVAPPPVAKPAPEIVVAAAPRPAPAPKPAGKPIETVAVKVTPPRIKLAPAPVAVAPKPVAVAVAPKPAPKPTPRQIEYARQTACPQYDKVAQDHMIMVNGFPVRCGPQAESPSGDVYGQRVVVAGGGAGSKIVAAPGTAPVAKSNVPAGYKMAWEDGRLNTKRGPISAQGDAQMAQVFEPGAVPMVPKGSRKVRVVAQAGAGDGGRIVAPPQFSVATKNDPKAARQPVAAAGRAWVQVGSFGVAANAAATAARLKAAGLPVAVTSVSRGGKSLQIVLAGPFASPGQVQAGLAAARSAGFKDAFVRN